MGQRKQHGKPLLLYIHIYIYTYVALLIAPVGGFLITGPSSLLVARPSKPGGFRKSFSLCEDTRARKAPVSKSVLEGKEKKLVQLLPPLLSKVLEPLPLSDISLGTLVQKIRGKSGTSPIFVAFLTVLLFPLLCYPALKGATAIYWPLHVALMKRFGHHAAWVATFSLMEISTVIFPFLLMLPMITPTAPGFQSEADKNTKVYKKLTNNWRYRINILSMGSLWTPLLMFATYPKNLLRDISTPVFRFWPTARQIMFCALAMEFVYYYKHRLMHQTQSSNSVVRWLVKVHKVHHDADKLQLQPLDATRLHDFELFSTVVSIMIGPILLRAHPMLALTWSAFMTSNAFFAHTHWFDHDEGKHTLHHQRSTCNYGLFGILDYFHKTSRAKSIDSLFLVGSMYRNMMSKQKNGARIRELMGELSSNAKTRTYGPNDIIARIGEDSDCFFVLEEGSCRAIIPRVEEGKCQEDVLMTYQEAGDVFGELSLLRNQPRAATLQAGQFGAKVSEFSKEDFAVIKNMTDTFEDMAESYVEGSSTAEAAEQEGMQDVVASRVQAYSALVEQQSFEPGETIFNQGDQGEAMYILEEGTCLASIDGKEVRLYKKSGEFFGELALLNNEPRKATLKAGPTGANLAVVERPVFDKFLRDVAGNADYSS